MKRYLDLLLYMLACIITWFMYFPHLLSWRVACKLKWCMKKKGGHDLVEIIREVEEREALEREEGTILLRSSGMWRRGRPWRERGRGEGGPGERGGESQMERLEAEERSSS